MYRKRAFTLVELLVVIGIIALLISILLPALSAARRQAASVKCLASLKELGNAWRMYAEENRGAACLLRVGGNGRSVSNSKQYHLNGILYGASSAVAGQSTTEAAWWMNFLAKYISKTKGGAGDMTNQATELNRKTVLWNCPEWTGYPETRAAIIALGGPVQHHYIGYSLNFMPTFTASYPVNTDETPDIEQIEIVLTSDNGPVDSTKCTWWKATKYTYPAQRAIMGDCFAIDLKSYLPKNPMVGQHSLDTGGIALSSGQSTFDFYRHGRYPKLNTAGTAYQPDGGKVSYNILYADGHATNATDRAEAYRCIRMRYPG